MRLCASIGMVACLVLSASTADAAKYTGFFRAFGQTSLNSADVTNGSVIFISQAAATQSYVGTACQQKSLSLVLELPFETGKLANFATWVATWRSQIPAAVLPCITAVSVGQELYPKFSAGSFCGFSEFSTYCIGGAVDPTKLQAGINAIRDFLGNTAHPAILAASNFPGRQITQVEPIFHATAAPVAAGTTFMTVDKYVSPTTTFEASVVPHITTSLAASTLPILLVGHAYSDMVNEQMPPPDYVWTPPAWPYTSTTYSSVISCPSATHGIRCGFRRNMNLYAYHAATNSRILGLVWFAYESHPPIYGLTDGSMSGERQLAIDLNAALRLIP